ncbi:hypothetical protein [Amphibacillus indicireducens]|uniref:Uncharacterized protein n=1 Tax=Amphibacillus indicireducens TaxID=1076330 RepID=A0ABP7VSR4_9BACI
MLEKGLLSFFKKVIKEAIKAGILILLVAFLFSKVTGDSVDYIALHLLVYSILYYLLSGAINYVKSKRQSE